MLEKLLNRIRKKCIKIRIRPIRVFVFHHVSDVRDPLVCQEADWTQLNQFKQNIEKLSKQYTFISLSQAYHKLQHDMIRCRRYAVLTTDDGLASVQNVIPWLDAKGIPLTLFINSRYMAGDKLKPIHLDWLSKTVPDADVEAIAKRMYLSREQIWKLNSPLIEIGLHGHNHLDATQISVSAFEKELTQCKELLCEHPRYVPAFAYTWGKSTPESLVYLHKNRIIPLLVDGMKNYQWCGYIGRESIDNMKF